MSIRRDQADIWFSKVVRARDQWCMSCGKTENLQAMHIVGRRNKAVRWSLDNAVTGCAGCHRYYTENPLAFHDWLRTLLGDGHLEMLREKAREIMKTNQQVRAEISKHYREEFKKIERNEDYAVISYN